MKATGIVRRIDDLGRITIPKEVRRTMGLNEGDYLELFVKDGYICYRKFNQKERLIDGLNNLVNEIEINCIADSITVEKVNANIDVIKKLLEDK